MNNFIMLSLKIEMKRTNKLSFSEKNLIYETIFEHKKLKNLNILHQFEEVDLATKKKNLSIKNSRPR